MYALVQTFVWGRTMDGVLLRCGCCGNAFIVCRRCWRGQRYCNKSCSRRASLCAHQQSQRKYSGTIRGRRSHSIRQKRYRKKRSVEKTETDATTTLTKDAIKPAYHRENCHVCGGIVRRVVELNLLKQDGSRFGTYFSFRRVVPDAFT